MRPSIPTTSLPTETAAGGEPPATTNPCSRVQSAPHTSTPPGAPRSRMEYFVFGLLAEMQGREVQLYGILRDGNLNRYPKVVV